MREQKKSSVCTSVMENSSDMAGRANERDRDARNACYSRENRLVLIHTMATTTDLRMNCPVEYSPINISQQMKLITVIYYREFRRDIVIIK